MFSTTTRKCHRAWVFRTLPISWASNRNRQCPATGSESQFDVDLLALADYHADCQSGECRTAIRVFSHLSSQTTSSPLAFHGVFYISEKCLRIRVSFTISHEEKFSTRTLSRFSFFGRVLTPDAAAAWLRMGLPLMPLTSLKCNEDHVQ